MLMLSLGEMVELLSSDELNVKNEEMVFDAAMRWINLVHGVDVSS